MKSVARPLILKLELFHQTSIECKYRVTKIQITIMQLLCPIQLCNTFSLAYILQFIQDLFKIIQAVDNTNPLLGKGQKPDTTILS